MDGASPADRSDLYRPLDLDILLDPCPTYRKLLTEVPTFWHGDLFAWVLTRYHDCRLVLQDPSSFTRDRRKLGRNVPPEGMTIQSLDPPDQVPLRRALMRVMQPDHVGDVIVAACETFNSRLYSQVMGQPFDFMQEVSAPVAIGFACKLVGMPEIEPRAYSSIFDRLTRGMDSALEARRYDEGLEATQELNELVQAAMLAPIAGSVIHRLLAAPEVAQMRKDYVRNTISATFNAAFSTAYSLMGSVLLLALQRGGLAKQIIEKNAVRTGVQELLRFLCPAQSTRRWATRDMPVGGVLIRAHDPVFTLIAAANRDAEVFQCPDELVICREPNRHLAFGSGPHHCAGAQPITMFLEALISRYAEWEARLVLADSPAWLDTFTLRCLARISVARTS
jgi:cytochrome P450